MEFLIVLLMMGAAVAVFAFLLNRIDFLWERYQTMKSWGVELERSERARDRLHEQLLWQTARAEWTHEAFVEAARALGKIQNGELIGDDLAERRRVEDIYMNWEIWMSDHVVFSGDWLTDRTDELDSRRDASDPVLNKMQRWRAERVKGLAAREESVHSDDP